MAAPLAAVVVAALTGAALPPAAATAVFGSYASAILVADSTVRRIYAVEQKICPAADAAADRIADRADAAAKGRRGFWTRLADRLARDADIVCNAAQAPNTPAGRLRASAQAVADIAKADAATPEPSAPAQSIAAAPRRGR